jgi:nitrite reductase/ring-hydroxylating ferredoxin subunit
MGVLEVLWQGIAFQSEADIDRAAAVARSLRYLRSVFPGHFTDAATDEAPEATAGAGERVDRLPPRAYRDAALLAAEREQLLRPAWQVLGHEAELRAAGDYLSAEVGGERALVVRAERGRLHAFRNACRHRPHALLTARRGHLKSAIHCAAHSLTYTFDGRLVQGATPGDLAPLPLQRSGRLLLVRAAGSAPVTPAAIDESVWEAFAALAPGAVTEHEVAADWKLLIEQWLESALAQQHFVPPNQLLEIRRDGACVLQVMPLAPGRSRVRRFEFSARGSARRKRRAVGERRPATWLKGQIALAESTQAGLEGAAEESAEEGPIVPALAQFRAQIAVLWQALAQEAGGR